MEGGSEQRSAPRAWGILTDPACEWVRGVDRGGWLVLTRWLDSLSGLGEWLCTDCLQWVSSYTGESVSGAGFSCTLATRLSVRHSPLSLPLRSSRTDPQRLD